MTEAVVQIVDSAVQTVIPAVLTIVPIQTIVSIPAIQKVIDLGLPKLVSPSEKVLLGVASTLVCHVDSSVSLGVWKKDVAKVEDGWTTKK